MAEVTVRIITEISDRWGTVTVNYQEKYDGQGTALVKQVNESLTAAVDRVREVIGYQVTDD